MKERSHKKGTVFLIAGIAVIVVLLIVVFAISHTVSRKISQKESEVAASGTESITYS